MLRPGPETVNGSETGTCDTLVLILLKLLRLKALKISPCKSQIFFFAEMERLRIEKSLTAKIGPVTIPTPLFPNLFAGAAAKCRRIEPLTIISDI